MIQTGVIIIHGPVCLAAGKNRGPRRREMNCALRLSHKIVFSARNYMLLVHKLVMSQHNESTTFNP